MRNILLSMLICSASFGSTFDLRIDILSSYTVYNHLITEGTVVKATPSILFGDNTIGLSSFLSIDNQVSGRLSIVENDLFFTRRLIYGESCKLDVGVYYSIFADIDNVVGVYSVLSIPLN